MYVCMYVCMHACIYVCVCLCMLCGVVVVSLAQAPPWQLSIWFCTCILPALPVHPALIGDVPFAGVQNQSPFS